MCEKRTTKRKEDSRKREEEPSTYWSTKIHCYSRKLKVHIRFYILKVYFYFQSTEHWIIYVTSSATCLTQTHPTNRRILRIPWVHRVPRRHCIDQDPFQGARGFTALPWNILLRLQHLQWDLHFLLLLVRYLKNIYPCKERIHYKSYQN